MSLNKLMEPVKIYISHAAQTHHSHTATDIHPHYIGNDLIPQISRKTYHTSGPDMYIGHNPYFLVGKYIY